MLSLWRRTGRRGAYPECALVLIHDGQVIGELLILQAQGDSLGGPHGGNGARVQVGLNLRADIEVVRADAHSRPSGPSDEWLAAREAAFEERQPFIRADGYPPTHAAFRAVGPYADPDATPDDASTDGSTDGSTDDRADDGDEWVATRPASSWPATAIAYHAPHSAPVPTPTNAPSHYVFRSRESEAGR